MSEDQKPCCSCCATTKDEPRRGFLAKMIALGTGAVALLTPVGIGLVSFVSPMRSKSPVGDFKKMATLDSLDSTPKRITIKADMVDAWTTVTDAPLGTIYLRKKEDGLVEALQASCPHAGCTIGVRSVDGSDEFFCPCHNAIFDINGVRTQQSSPSPRNMDSLEVKIEGNDVLVKFEYFQPGSSEKKSLT